ncbi:MAG TPA: tetratricopeptide repeat protein [Chthoniobacterales bacterium]|nr:tetratricopeptide repeat protein [Chthoniobacterales bacterium]
MPGGERKHTILVCVGLFALTWLVFGKTLRFEFLNYDDPEYVAANPAINNGLSLTSVRWAFTSVHGGNWHPLTSLSHMLDVQLFGLNPAGHHFVNVLLHSISAVLLFLALRRLSPATGGIWPAAFVSAIFAIHPLRLESVAWVSERKDVLSAALFMATLLLYLRYVARKSLGNYALLAVVFALGLMAKPMLVTVPVVLLLLDFWPLGRTSRTALPRLILEKLPLAVLAGVSSVATLIAQKGALESFQQASLMSRIINAAVSAMIYLRQFVWPAGLAVFYPYPRGSLSVEVIVFCVALLSGVTVIVTILRKSIPFLFIGWWWYLVMLVPVLGIIQVGLQAHADRFTYLPQIGLTIGLAWGAAALARRLRLPRPALWLASSLIIAALAISTSVQAGSWRNSEALWNRALSVTTDNDVAHTNLSEVCLKSGRPDGAIHHARAALSIYPNNAQAANNLGVGLLRTNRAAEAKRYFEQSVRLRPDGVNATQSLAWILAASPDANQRDGKRAVELAEHATKLTRRGNVIVLHTLAAAYAATGRFNDAVRVGEEALSLATARGDTRLLPELTFSLQRYRSSQPVRDPGLIQRHP